MKRITIETTLTYDENVDPGKAHMWFYEALENARKDGLLSTDEISCDDIESHVVGMEE